MTNTIQASRNNDWDPQILAASMPSRDDQNSVAINILEIIEDSVNNRDTGGGELEMIADIARRIGNIAGFSGLSSFAQHAVLLNAERQSNNPAIAGIENFWEWIKEKIKEDEKVAFNNADFASDVQQAAQQTAMNQNDYSKTYTNSDLDAMEWKGDENEVWSLLGKAATRRQHYEALKQTRNDLEKIAMENGWSPEKKALEDKLLQNAMQAIINNDPAKAAQFTSQMDPETKKKFEWNRENITGNGVSHEVQQTASVAINTQTSANSRGDIYEATPRIGCAANDLSMGSACDTVIAASNRPTSAFNQSANPQMEAAPTATVSNSTLSMAQVAETPKAKVAALESF